MKNIGFSWINHFSVNCIPAMRRKAYLTILDKIVSLKYKPGDYLEESTLSKELNIGRTPIREALQMLYNNLLLDSRFYKGFLVKEITLQDTKSAFSALETLEVSIAEIVIQQQNSEQIDKMNSANRCLADSMKAFDIYQIIQCFAAFHHSYACCSNNIYLIQSLFVLGLATSRIIYLFLSSNKFSHESTLNYSALILAQQQRIVDGIKIGDENKLRALIVENINIVRTKLIHYMIEDSLTA